MISKDLEQKIYRLKREGYSISDISRLLRISRPTIMKYLNIEDSNSNPTPPVTTERPDKLAKKAERLENKKYDTAIAKTEFELESLNDARIEKEKRKRLEKQIELENLRREKDEREEKRQRQIEELEEIRQAQEEERRQQQFITARDQWLARKLDHGIHRLKYEIPSTYSELLTTKHLLAFKESLRRLVSPLFNKETDSTIDDLIKETASEFYQEHIYPSVRVKQEQKRREELVEDGVRKIFWETRDDEIDFDERQQLESYVRRELKNEIQGDETDQELTELVQDLIDQWFEM